MNSKVTLVLRILLGLMMLIFGLNKFLQFMPMPELPEAAGKFMGALMESGYLMQLVAIVEIVAGVLLLVGKYVPLALVILFPVMLNALLFHVFLDPAGSAGAAVAVILNVVLFFAYKDRYSSILSA